MPILASRAWSTDTMYASQLMVLEVKKAPSACAPYGMLHNFSRNVASLLSCRCVEALTRAGQSDRQLLPKAVSMFEVCT